MNYYYFTCIQVITYHQLSKFCIELILSWHRLSWCEGLEGQRASILYHTVCDFGWFVVLKNESCFCYVACSQKKVHYYLSRYNYKDFQCYYYSLIQNIWSKSCYWLATFEKCLHKQNSLSDTVIVGSDSDSEGCKLVNKTSYRFGKMKTI